MSNQIQDDDKNAQDSSLITIYEVFDKMTQTVIVFSPLSPHPLMMRSYPYFGHRDPHVISLGDVQEKPRKMI